MSFQIRRLPESTSLSDLEIPVGIEDLREFDELVEKTEQAFLYVTADQKRGEWYFYLINKDYHQGHGFSKDPLVALRAAVASFTEEVERV